MLPRHHLLRNRLSQSVTGLSFADSNAAFVASAVNAAALAGTGVAPWVCAAS